MESAVLNPEAWDLTIVRAQGLRLMRPEKAWRPIVTIEVDKLTQHETILGIDGQNPNLKQIFRFYDVKPTSKLEMKVWHRSQSKKKSKKRNLVATATHSLGDLLKKLETENVGGGSQINLRMACQTPSKKTVTSSNSKGRPQNGALLTIKLTPPQSQRKSHIRNDEDVRAEEYEPSSHSTDEQQSGYTSEAPSSPSSSASSSLASKTLIDVQPPSPITEVHSHTSVLPSPPGLRLRPKRPKRTRGYSLFSDEDFCEPSGASSDSDSSSASGSASRSGKSSFNSSTSIFEGAVRSVPLDSCFDSYSDTEEKLNAQTLVIKIASDDDGSEVVPISFGPSSRPSSPTKTGSSIRRWIAASLLPQHVLVADPKADSVALPSLSPAVASGSKPTPLGPPSDCETVPPYTENGDYDGSSNKWWERFLGNFTFYLELRDARVDSQYEAILHQLRLEWTFMGGFLAALGAVDVAVLAVGPDSVIPLTKFSLRAIASSSIFTGLGITALAYFILRYSFAPPPLFRARALDLYQSYAFFAVSARVPTLCMVASAVGLLVFLTLVAFEVWPVGVVVVCFLVGILMSLQFLVYGCHMFIRGVIGALRKIVGGVRAVVMKGPRAQSGGSAVAGGDRGGEVSAGPSRMKASRPTAGVPTTV